MTGSLTSRTLARGSFETAFEPTAFVRAMLAFEAALAEACAAEGLIAPSASQAVAQACERLRPDLDLLVAEGKRSASLAVPLVNALIAEVRKSDPQAARNVHFGATSQDVLDTAMALCLKPCLVEADRSLDGAVRALARHAQAHRATPMLGRTLMQPALPISAGLKLARWALALAQDRARLAQAASAALAVQLGGPVGALEAFGAKGHAVRKRVAQHLGLADAPAWHSHRNAWIDLLDRIGFVVLTAGKIAGDVALLAQAEVGEMQEAPPQAGVGVSSAMPHKRNPVACVHAIAAATRLPGLLSSVHAASLAEHERALGGWQAELTLVPEIASALGSSLEFLDTIAASLVVNPARMQANLEAARVPGASADTLPALDELLDALRPYRH